MFRISPTPCASLHRRLPSPSPRKPMRVLAIDPSLRGTGFAVLEAQGTKVRAVEYGTIRNSPALLPSGCLVAIHERVTDLIRSHRPECAAFEGVIYVQSY